MVTFTPGGPLVQGNIGVTGTWNIGVGAVTAVATLSTPTPLVLTPSCATLITGGTVTGSYEDSAGSTGSVSVAFTGCGAHTVTQSGGNGPLRD
jgi:hypothetical protein